MHEGNFTEQIVKVILDELEKHAGACPSQIHVKVGEMLHLHSDSVQMHYRVMTQNTPLEKSKLNLEEVPVSVRCKDCGEEGRVLDHHLLMCCACDSRNVDVLRGHEVVIEKIEFEKKEAHSVS